MNPTLRGRITSSLPLLLSAALATSVYAATLPAGTPLPVQTEDHLPMRAGETVRAELLYPVYVDGHLVLPAKTTVVGTVVELNANHQQRVRARLNGDFTPFHTPAVRFTQIVLADGTALAITSTAVTDGAPILRLTAPAPRKGGFIRKQWDAGMQILHGQIAVFTAPEKGDRLLQLFYHQLPYHPERIEKGTAWTAEISEPVTVPDQPPSAAASATAAIPADPPAAKPTAPDTWTIEAYLRDPFTSATAKSGQPVQAVVAEPVYNPDHTVAVPQGAILLGAVTQAHPARSFARGGALGFDFRQILLPDGKTQNVQSVVAGADAATAANLAMNSEGKVQPKPQDKIVIPFLLAFFAAAPLGKTEELGPRPKNFLGANGFGVAGNLIALAGGSPNIAAGIGAYGTALSLYRRWIAHGSEVSFARDTRIIVEATPRKAAVLKSPGL